MNELRNVTFFFFVKYNIMFDNVKPTRPYPKIYYPTLSYPTLPYPTLPYPIHPSIK